MTAMYIDAPQRLVLRSQDYAPTSPSPPYYTIICKILYSITNYLMSFQFDFNLL